MRSYGTDCFAAPPHSVIVKELNVLRQIILCLTSLVLGISIALLVGSFKGYYVNPDRSAAFAAAHKEMVQSGMGAGTLEELQNIHRQLAQKYPGYDALEPPMAITVLKTHPFLMGIFLLVFLGVFRPDIRSIFIVFLPVIIAVHLLINYKAAGGVIVVAVLAGIWSIVDIRVKKRAP